MRPAYGWLMVPLLAACAAGAPQWDKPGAAQAAIDEDLQKCRLDARLSPEPRLAGGPSPTSSSSGSPLTERGQERDSQETQEVRRCMEGKGYRVTR